MTTRRTTIRTNWDSNRDRMNDPTMATMVIAKMLIIELLLVFGWL